MATWAAKDLAQGVIKGILNAAKKKAKNLQAFLAGNTNIRTHPFLLLSSMGYIYNRSSDDCVEDEACFEIGKQTNLKESDKMELREKAKAQVLSTLKKIIFKSKYEESYNNGVPDPSDSICYQKSTTHGYAFELLLLTYYHALDEFGAPGAKSVSGIQEHVKIPLLEKDNEGNYQIYTTFSRYIDIQLGNKNENEGKDENDLEWIEAKSVQAFSSKKTPTNRQVTKGILNRWGPWSYHTEGKKKANGKPMLTMPHRQLFLDRVGTTEVPDKARELKVDGKPIRKLANNFKWQLQSWEECYKEVKKRISKTKTIKFWADTGVSFVWGKVCKDHHNSTMKSRKNKQTAPFDRLRQVMSELPKPPSTRTSAESKPELVSLGYKNIKENKLFDNQPEPMHPFKSFSVKEELLGHANLKEYFELDPDVQEVMDQIGEYNLDAINDALDQIPSLPIAEWLGINDKINELFNEVLEFATSSQQCKAS